MHFLHVVDTMSILLAKKVHFSVLKLSDRSNFFFMLPTPKMFTAQDGTFRKMQSFAFLTIHVLIQKRGKHSTIFMIA